jgi:hypothetical protein
MRIIVTGGTSDRQRDAIRGVRDRAGCAGDQSADRRFAHNGAEQRLRRHEWTRV